MTEIFHQNELIKNIKNQSSTSPMMGRRAFLGLGVGIVGAGMSLSPGLASAGISMSRDFQSRHSWVSNDAGFVSQEPTRTAIKPAIPKWPQPNELRQVWLQRKETGESIVARYHDGNKLVMDQYVACCSVLRDVQSGSVVNIDLDLLDLVFSMQKWLTEWGIDRPLLVHSGYRSPKTNMREGGVRNSLHLHGKAIDFTIQGIPAEYMGRLATVVGVGGVGFYIGQNGFTHIDTGSVRVWSQRRSKRQS